MKIQLCKKLPDFITVLIVTITVLLFNGSCSKDIKSLNTGKTSTGNSKIVYTDVNPDSLITNSSYAPDLNKDGIKDFTLTSFTHLGRCCTGTSRCYVSHVEVIPNSGGLNAIMNDGKNNALALDSLAIIGGSGSRWSKPNPPAQILNCTAYCNYCDTSYWKNAAVKYLGLRITIGSNTYYGWMRLSTGTGVIGAFMRVKDYAYNSIPNQPILAGQTK